MRSLTEPTKHAGLFFDRPGRREATAFVLSAESWRGLTDVRGLQKKGGPHFQEPQSAHA